jgi:cadmium resistance protein CadD (predicted permease)
MPHLQLDTSPSFVTKVFGSWLNPEISSVAAITVGNGLDNIATYIPLFGAGNIMRMGILIGIFLLLIGLWCYIGHALVSLPIIANTTERYGHVVLPFIFITLGMLIMIETGTIVW